MPRIDNVKRLNADDFPVDSQETVARIAEIYNFFAEQVTNTLNGEIDFDNLNRAFLQLDVNVDSNGNPVNATRFSNNVGLLGIKVINAVNLTNRVIYPTGTPFISFTASGTGVYTINNITNLKANNNYRLSLELIFS